MKKILIASTLFFSLGVHAQVDPSKMLLDTANVKFIEPPDSTGFGTPDGQLVSKEIGPGGGTIASDDGRVELIFPSDALPGNTKISIQSTTNLAPNGTGNAYQFEPSGIQFNKPVQVIFHYTDEEAETCPPDLMGFALQDPTGKWIFFDYDELDSATKILKGNIEHFTGFASLDKMKLVPVSRELRIGDTLFLHVIDNSPKFRKKDLMFNYARIHENQVPVWFVNGLQNGDGGKFGRTNAFTSYFNPNFKLIAANYQTPEILPPNNPVVIKVKLWVDKIKGNKETVTLQKIFTSKIRLYDEYKILVRDTVEVGVSMGTFVADSGSFVTRLEPNQITVSQVKNYSPYLSTKHGAPRPYKKQVVWIDRSCFGSVNIGRQEGSEMLMSYSTRFSQPDADGPPEVIIRFNSDEVLVCKFVLVAGSAKSDPVPLKLKAVPEIINFKANGRAQVIPVSNNRDSPYHIYITPTKTPQFYME